MKISPVKYSYSFSAYHKNNIEKHTNSATGDLTHTSHLFRWDRNYGTNRIIGNYLKKQYQNQPINILSLGCSYGEEVYSLAMTMDYYGVDSKIKGMDISQSAIDGARFGKYPLSGYEAGYLFKDYPYNINEKNISDFQKSMRKKFQENFRLTDKTKRTYQKKDGTFQNCEFFQGDITNLDRYFEKNSQDLITCSFVLYHLDYRDLFNTINQIYDTLKPGGILCISPLEEQYTPELKLAGFRQPNHKTPWMFQKPKEDESFGFDEAVRLFNLNQKANFDNI